MFIIAPFERAKWWKQPKCPLAHKWMNKLLYTHRIKYYATKRKMKYWCTYEPWTPYMQIKEARHRKLQVVWSHSYEISRTGKSIETENRPAVAGGSGKRGMGSCCIMLTGFRLGDDENVLESVRGGSCRKSWMY